MTIFLVFYFPQWLRKVWSESAFSMKSSIKVVSYEIVSSISFLLKTENTESEHIHIFSLSPFLSLSLPVYVCLCFFSFLNIKIMHEANYLSSDSSSGTLSKYLTFVFTFLIYKMWTKTVSTSRVVMSIKIINTYKAFRTVAINSQKMFPAIIIWYPNHLSQF